MGNSGDSDQYKGGDHLPALSIVGWKANALSHVGVSELLTSLNRFHGILLASELTGFKGGGAGGRSTICEQPGLIPPLRT